MLFGATDVHPHASFWLYLADKFVKGVALVAGGLWATMNYQRGRTYKQRLEPTVSGEIFSKNGSDYVCEIADSWQSIQPHDPER
jgi:hypothetical protein